MPIVTATASQLPAMIEISTPHLKRLRSDEKPQLPMRAQTEGCTKKSKPRVARTGPTLPFLSEFSAEDAHAAVESHIPSRLGKKKRCWSANF